MKKILITRKLLKSSEEYASKIFNVQLNKDDKLLTKDELISNSSECDGILSSLTEKFDADIISKLSKKVKIIVEELGFKDFIGIDYVNDPNLKKESNSNRPYKLKLPITKITQIKNDGSKKVFLRLFKKSKHIGYGLPNL